MVETKSKQWVLLRYIKDLRHIADDIEHDLKAPDPDEGSRDAWTLAEDNVQQWVDALKQAAKIIDDKDKQ